MAPSVSSVRRHWLLLVAPWIGATMSANQAHRFLSRPLVHAIRTGCALVAAGQLIGVSVAAMPRPDAAVAERRASYPPLAFEPNHGQADGEVEFLARGAGYTAFFTGTEMGLSLGDGGHRRAIVRLKPVGANTGARLVGDGELPGAGYGRASYRGVYPGIDLVYYGTADHLEYDFVVAPGADPERIVLTFDGVERLAIDGDGSLVAQTVAGELRQPPPVVYQESDGSQHRVDAEYVIDREGSVRIHLGAYDPSRQLVIDPVLTFSTYLGGSGDEADDFLGAVVGVAVDTAGNVYVTGTTQSADFPTTPGANGTLGGNEDVFVTKFSPTGAVLYSTYVGGPCDDIGRAITVDAAGNAYITGRTNAGVCLSGPPPGVLVAKLGPTGAVVYSFVFGGSLADSSIGQGIKVDAAGQAYVTGLAASSSRDFPVTPGAFRTTPCEDVWDTADGFVAKINAAGTALVYSTYLCGTGNDSPNGIAIDAAGNAYVAGSTTSPDFPSVNALQPSLGSADGANGFVSKLSADGAHLVYSTYLGGSGDDAIGGIALDGDGNVYVTGETTSTDFPTTPGVVQEQAGYRLCVPIGPCTDAFVTKIDPSGSALVYSTYLYGELDDGGSGVAVDAAGNAYVVGTTGSQFFPILDAFQPARGGVFDAFVAKLAPDGTGLAYSSYLGGSQSAGSLITGWNEGTAIALDTAGSAYVVGSTQAADFPTTPGAFQQHLGGGGCNSIGLACRDAFVARITPGGAGVVPDISLGVTPADAAPGGPLTATWAGIPAPTASDVLSLYLLGSGELGIAPDRPALASWPTGGAAGGTLVLTLPPALLPGTYELRLLNPDPNSYNQLTAIARSEPIRVEGSTTTQPTSTATSTTATPSTISTTTLPCTTARCSLDASVASPACAGQVVPSSVTTKFDRATTLLEEAGTSPAKQAGRLLKQARRALKSAKASTSRASSGKKPKISSECATVLEDAAARVLSDLQR